ncbi:MAG: hypothetical protein QXZ09_07840, partial [Candidatus Methanomethylicaceae archaeon]
GADRIVLEADGITDLIEELFRLRVHRVSRPLIRIDRGTDFVIWSVCSSAMALHRLLFQGDT